MNSRDSKLISIVISSYNDAEIIIPYYEAIAKHLSSQTKYDWELIYVDDGSKDNSANVLKELAKKSKRVTAIELNCNVGQQKVQFCGLQESRGDIIITLDGDYQYPPEVISKLADKIMEGYDIVSGVRVTRKDPFLTKASSRFGNILLQKMISKKVSDFGAVKAFSRPLINAVISNKMYATQVYGLAYSLTNRYCEIPVDHISRYSGVSKWSFWMRFEMYLELFLLCGGVNFKYIYILSLLMVAGGGSYLSIVIISRLLFNNYISSGVGSIVLMMTGLIVFSISIALSITLKIFKTVSLKNDTIIRSKTRGEIENSPFKEIKRD